MIQIYIDIIFHNPLILVSEADRNDTMDSPASLRCLRALDSVKEATS